MDLTAYYDAQVAVLGSLLREPEKLGGEIMQRLSATDFGDPVFQTVFKAARSIYNSGQALDRITLAARLDPAYGEVISGILAATPTAHNWKPYCDLVRDGARLSKLQEIASEILAATSFNAGSEALLKAQQLLTDRPGRRASCYGDMLSEYLDRQADKTPPDYLDFGIDALNRNLSVSPGRFLILGADSAVGKTAFALQLAYNFASRGKRVGFFSYETSRADAIDRIVANTASVNLPRSKAKALSSGDRERVSAEGMRSDRIDLTVIESAGYTVDELRAETVAGRYDVIFIDYVQLVPGRASDRWQVVTQTSMALHTMAQQLGVTIIALSQVTPPETDKQGKRRSLNKSDLRESRQLINDADVIMMMDLENPNDPQSTRLLKIDKNKDGPRGQIELDFDAQHMRFSPHVPTRSESYTKVMGQLAAQRKAERQQAEAADQITFEELPDSGEELPF